MARSPEAYAVGRSERDSQADVGDVASSPAKDPCSQSPRLVTPEGLLVGDIVPKLLGDIVVQALPWPLCPCHQPRPRPLSVGDSPTGVRGRSPADVSPREIGKTGKLLWLVTKQLPPW